MMLTTRPRPRLRRKKETLALFDAVDIIRTKRDGGVLTPDQIDWVIDAYTKGVVKD